MNEFLERTYFNNTVREYLIALGIILAGIIIVKSFKKFILRKIRSWTNATETDIDDFLIESIDRFGIPALYFGVVYLGVATLDLTETATKIFKVATTVVVIFLAIRFISSVVLMFLRSYVKSQENGEEKVKQLGGIMLIINIVIWAIGLLFLFDNLGFDVTAMVTGLGIGGIAVALAAQNILGDLFNYFVIFFDKPFEIGDFIIVDDKLGVVDYIGIKTTRLKSLSGEQLVLSNSDLTSSRIHNYKRMQRRRVLFRVGVIYQTTHKQLSQISPLLKSIVEAQENVQFDRAHFASFGDSSLDFEIVYYVLSSDYNVYMDIQQNINMRIYEEFEKMGVEIAYPTRTLFLANQDKQEETEDSISRLN